MEEFLARHGHKDAKVEVKREIRPTVTNVTPKPVTHITNVTAPVTDVTNITPKSVMNVTQSVTTVTHCPGCRCRKYKTAAERQRAYRERKKGKP